MTQRIFCGSMLEQLKREELELQKHCAELEERLREDALNFENEA